MNQDELKAVFDQQAPGYERQQQRLAPVHDGLYFQLQWILSGLPRSARILCVGLGAGAELSYLAGRFPGWSFTAVEPSEAMLSACRRRAETEGFASGPSAIVAPAPPSSILMIVQSVPSK